MTNNSAADFFQLGLKAHRQNNLALAKIYYNETIKLQPSYAAAHFNLGRMEQAKHNHEIALSYFKSAVNSQPSVSQFWIALISTQAILNYYDEALQSIAQTKTLELYTDAVIELENEVLAKISKSSNQQNGIPFHPSSVEMQKLVKLIQERNLDLAWKRIQTLLRDFPQSCLLYNLGGLVLTKSNQNVKAKEWFKFALSINSTFTDAHINLGNLYVDLQLIELAKKHLKIAIELQPKSVAGLNALGKLHNKIGEFDTALEFFNKAVNINPTIAEIHNNRGNAWRSKKQLDAAIDCYKYSIEINKNYVPAYLNLGKSLAAKGNLAEAVKVYKSALLIAPENYQAHTNIGALYLRLGEPEKAKLSFETAIRNEEYPNEAYSNLLFTIYGSQMLSPKDRLEVAKGYNKCVNRKIVKNSKVSDNHLIEDKIRLGFISGDLHSHPVAYFFESFIKYIDKSKFHLTVFSNNKRRSEETGRIIEHVNQWFDIYNLDDQDSASLIADQHLSILIDLSGHTFLNRLPVLANRPAKIQATWLGYFATTGLSEIDFIIGDDFLIPKTDEKYFTEKVIRLPDGYICFEPPKTNLEVNQTPALNNGFLTFGCFNNASKVGPKVIKAWAEILQTVENSKLLFKGLSYTQDIIGMLVNEFGQFGVDDRKLKFEGPANRNEMLGSYNDIDISLDTFPYPGGTTTCEALWMGVPTITLKGSDFLSNVGVSINMNADHESLICENLTEYIDKAIQLSYDLPSLNESRLARRQRVLNSNLFNGRKFAGSFERICIEMLEL